MSEAVELERRAAALALCEDRLPTWHLLGADTKTDIFNLVRALTKPEGEPVAWRVKDFADGWILFHDELGARLEAEGAGNLVQPLYTRPPVWPEAGFLECFGYALPASDGAGQVEGEGE